MPKEAEEVSKEFASFLNAKKLERSAISDVTKNVKGMVDKIQRAELMSPEHVDELSEKVQDFYSHFQKRLETHPIYKSKKTILTNIHYFLNKILIWKLSIFTKLSFENLIF